MASIVAACAPTPAPAATAPSLPSLPSCIVQHIAGMLPLGDAGSLAASHRGLEADLRADLVARREALEATARRFVAVAGSRGLGVGQWDCRRHRQGWVDAGVAAPETKWELERQDLDGVVFRLGDSGVTLRYARGAPPASRWGVDLDGVACELESHAGDVHVFFDGRWWLKLVRMPDGTVRPMHVSAHCNRLPLEERTNLERGIVRESELRDGSDRWVEAFVRRDALGLGPPLPERAAEACRLVVRCMSESKLFSMVEYVY